MKKIALTIICVLMLTIGTPITFADDEPIVEIDVAGETICLEGQEYTYNANILSEYKQNYYYRFVFSDMDNEPDWVGPHQGNMDVTQDYVWSIPGDSTINVEIMLYNGNLEEFSEDDIIFIDSDGIDIIVYPIDDVPPAPEQLNGEYMAFVGQEYMYATSIFGTDRQIYYQFVWGDGSRTMWIGPCEPEVTFGHSHIWEVSGIYYASVRASYYEYGWFYSESRPLFVLANSPPPVPELQPFEPNAIVTEEYEFSAITYDTDGNPVSYLFDWGDGTQTGWLGPFDSGEYATSTHSWNEVGDYEIKVKAKDILDLESDWSNPRVINVGYALPPRPSTPTGPSSLLVDEEGMYFIDTIEDCFYQFVWDDGTQTGWTASPPGFDLGFKHSWDTDGIYNVIVRASYYPNPDEFGEYKESNPKQVTVVLTPETPEAPHGDSSVYVDESNEYMIYPSEEMYYQIVWGDGTQTEWIYSDHVETISESHTFTRPLTYDVKVRVSYYSDGNSYAESEPLQVTAIYEEIVSITEIKGGIGIKVSYENEGKSSAHVDIKVSMYGKRIIREVDEILIDDSFLLHAGDSGESEAKVRGIRWFGRVEITVRLKTPNEPAVTETVNGFKLGPFILIRK